MKSKIIIVLLLIFLISLTGIISFNKIDTIPEVRKEVTFIGPPEEVVEEVVVVQDTNKVAKISKEKSVDDKKSNKRLYEQKSYNENLKKQIDKLESIQKDTIN